MTTKSGTNDFAGAIGFYYAPRTLGSDPKTNGFGTSTPSPEGREIAGNLGGPIVRDRLFFFLSASRLFENRLSDQRDTDLFGRTVAESKTIDNLYSAKLSWQMDTRNLLTASFLSDPGVHDVRDELGGVGGDRRVKRGGLDYSVQYRSILSSNMILELQAGSHSELNKISPPPDQEEHFPIGATRADSTPSIRVRETDQRELLGEPSLKFGPYAYSGKTDASRRFLRGTFEGLWATHNMKFGGEIEPADYSQNLEYGWGTGMALEWAPGGLTRNGIQEQIIGVRRCWGNGHGECQDWDHQVQADGATATTRLFVQDRWLASEYLSINYGVRWESQKISDAGGKTLARINDELAPRLGVIYDPTGDGRNKISVSGGRFYDSVPMQVVSRAFAPRIIYTRLYRARDWTYQNFVSDIFGNGICAGNSSQDDSSSPSCWDFESRDISEDNIPATLTDQVHTSRGVGNGSRVFRPDTIVDSGSLYRAPIDTHLKGASTDEAILQYDAQLGPNYVAGVKLIERSLNDAIEDVSLDYGHNFIITNPGGPYRFFVDPANRDLWNPDYVAGSADPAAKAGFAQLVGCRPGRVCTLTNDDLARNGFEGVPKATRDYRGLELTFAKQTTGKFWFNGSYLYSKTEGNYRGRYFVETEERDPNLTEAFDTPALTVNTTGLLPQDHRHQVKLFGNVKPAPSLDLGVTYRFSTGSPYSLTSDPAGGSTPFLGPIFLLKRGSGGTTPNTQNLDLRLAWVAQDTTKVRLSFIAEIFNVLNEQKPVVVDEAFLAPGLWRSAFYSQIDGKVEFLQKGRGEPYDGYVDQVFGNGDGTVTRSEWNAWARFFQGRFDSAQQLYHYLKNEKFDLNVGGAMHSASAYPGFESCPASLPSNLARCEALNSGFGSAKSLEAPRSVRFGVRVEF